ncbi:FAD-binding oxidoreductase [Herbaspirillum lusitanum]|uniref:FAD-binding oxidoreductase n=1 Tax=Herbaspirillum lusitanum TaxID=213312 RepID=A0ABW9A913_9BURK
MSMPTDQSADRPGLAASGQSGLSSLWLSTAGPAPLLPTLAGDCRTEVAIIGAGYSGLAAAHRLQQRGVAAVVLDANEVGFGGSGRNGGVVSAKYRLSFPAIAGAYGLDIARLMHRIAHESVDAVEELVQEFGIGAAGFARVGNLKCAHTERSSASIVAEAEWLQRELGDRAVAVLTPAEVAAETGSRSFRSGVLTKDAGAIHPLNYIRGLAAGLAARQVQIYEHSPVTEMQRASDGVSLLTPRGRVHAQQVIVATDAWSNLSPATRRFRQSIIPFRSAIIATEPLPPELNARLLVNCRSYTETRRMMKWFRKVDGRVIFGGRGAFGKQESMAAFDGLQHGMCALFPELQAVRVTHRWSGFVGMTMDQLPHVGRQDDRISFCVGYNGAGVAMASMLGRYAADFAMGEQPAVGLLDASRLKAVPFYPLREAGVRMVAGWYQLLDAIGR